MGMLAGGFYKFEEVVTLTNVTITHNGIGSGAKAGVRLNTDGTLSQRKGESYTALNPDTDWVIPHAFTKTYHVQWTQTSGACDFTPFAVSTWTAVSGGPYEWREETPADDQDSCVIEIYISDDGGSTTLDSGTFTLAAVDLP